MLDTDVLVWMKILRGPRNKQEQTALSEKVARYTILRLESGDSERSWQWFEQFHLSHGVGVMNCLIAAIAVRIGKPFYTFNLKHFQVIPAFDVHAPYQRPEQPRS